MWCESTYSDCDPSGEAWRKNREDEAKKKKQKAEKEEEKRRQAGDRAHAATLKKSNNRVNKLASLGATLVRNSAHLIT